MKKTTFYSLLRSQNGGLFSKGLSQEQVDGIEALLREGDGLPAPHMANILAQVHRETGSHMFPIKETVMPWHKNKTPSDQAVIGRLDKAFSKGQLSWVSKPYWRDGMFGRGQIQITHASNYGKDYGQGFDLKAAPHRALELSVSAKIAVRGMSAGMFTGRKLSDYNAPDGYDHYGARAIVNGDGNKRDKGSIKTVGEKIATTATHFESALNAAGWAEALSKAKKTPRSEGGLAAALLQLISALFGKAR